MTEEQETSSKNHLISLADAAKIYGLNADHLRHLAQKGRLHARKIGNSWATTRADMETYIGSRKKRGAYRNDIQVD